MSRMHSVGAARVCCSAGVLVFSLFQGGFVLAHETSYASSLSDVNSYVLHSLTSFSIVDKPKAVAIYQRSCVPLK